MDVIERLLVEELTRLDVQPVRAADDALAAVARRRARRTGAAVGVAGLAVLAVLGGVLTVVDRTGGPGRPVGPPATSTGAGFSFHAPRPAGVFVSAADGFLVLDRCADTGCRRSLAATADGGRTWVDHSLPATSGEEGEPSDLGAFDARTLAYVPSTYEPDAVHLSADGGRTWRRAAPEPSFAAVPAGARVAGVGPERIAVLTADDRFGWLRVRPSAGFSPRQVALGGDGSIVALGVRRAGPPDLAAGTIEVWVSTDGARTWQPRFPPSVRPRQIPATSYLYTVDGRTVCTLHTWLGEGADFPDHDLEAWLARCSGDGGASWHQINLTGTPAGPGEPVRLQRVIGAMLSDGGLLLSTARGLVHVAPGATEPVPVEDGSVFLTTVMGGGAIRDDDGGLGVPRVTRDGRTWTPVAPGPD
jgi:hypothetical protein